MRDRKKGFTIVELMIAITMLSVLMLAIMTLTVSLSRLYMKGMTHKSVNQVVREFDDMFRRDLLSKKANDITLVNDPTNSSGRLCLGGISYLWNTADALNSGKSTTALIKYNGTPIHFIRVNDVSKLACSSGASGNKSEFTSTDFSGKELLTGDGRELGVYAMSFKPIGIKGESALYKIIATIGTAAAGTTEVQDGRVICKPQGGLANFEFCAVNDFEALVRVGGDE